MKTYPFPCIDELISDRNLFNSFIYTPVEEAVKELELRKDNTEIQHYINLNIPFGLPQYFNGEKNAVLGRQVATPNFELLRFSGVADTLPGFNKIVLEMHNDRFTPNLNASKYHLGKIVFNSENIRNRKTKSMMTVDFNKYSGRKISEVNTVWGQRFTDFHREFLEYCLSKESGQKINQVEASEWIWQAGKTAKEYYPKYLSLFLQNGILFENFLMKEKNESAFTKEVFLPAFIKVMQETGIKPLIVSFLPIESEGSDFWNYYPEEYFEFVSYKMEVAEIMKRKVAA